MSILMASANFEDIKALEERVKELEIRVEELVFQVVAIEKATEAYRESEDLLGDFLSECCVVGDGESVKASELYKVYQEYCHASGQRPLESPRFNERLGKGYERWRTKECYLWKGLALNPNREADD